MLKKTAAPLLRRRLRRLTTSSGTPEPPISGIGRSVIARLDPLPSPTYPSLQHLLNAYLDLSPPVLRRLWRAPPLHPPDFLHLSQTLTTDGPRKLDFLLNLLTLSPALRHHPTPCRILIPMLVRARRLSDARSLLLSLSPVTATADAGGLFTEVIRGYVDRCEFHFSVALYDRARSLGLVPSADCYHGLLDLGVRTGNAEVVTRVCKDMMEAGMVPQARSVDFVIRSLSEDGRILEAVGVLRRGRESGVEARPRALATVAQAYVEKRDFDDMLNFLEEWKYIPDAIACNKIVSSLCRYLGAEEAWLLVRRMEALGFEMDTVTVGILVSHSCTERKLTSAFVYLSECFARGITPSAYTYNSLISGLFREAMHWCAKDTFEDMVENGVTPDRSTFKVLLAGYCKYRKFEQAKWVLNEMISRGVASLDPAEDALSKAFRMLGLDSFGVKVKRDNNAGLPRAEFFDSLGNGLYLETDEEKYDASLAATLESFLVPDLDSVILEKCREGDVEAALGVLDEVIQLGQNVTLSTFSELLRIICPCRTHLRKVVDLFEEMPELCDQLDDDILNMLIRTLSRSKRMLSNAKLILDNLLKRGSVVETDIYNRLIVGFSKERNIILLRECLELARRSMCPSGSEDVKDIVRCLCELEMIKEMLEFLDSVLDRYPHLTCSFCSSVITELYLTGFASVGNRLADEVFRRGLVLDQTACLDLIVGFMKEGKSVQALKVVDMLLEKKITTDTNVYQLLISSLFSLNSMEKAMSLKESMLSSTSSAADVSVYCTLVNELCKLGKTKEATIELQEMLVNNLFPDDNVLNALLKGYCRESDMGKANELLCIMLRKNVDLSVESYRSLIRKMCQHGKDLDGVRLLQLFHGNDKCRLLQLYDILIYHLFLAGKCSLVESLLTSMRLYHLDPGTTTYNFLIYGFYKCGNVSRSISTLYTMISEGLTPSSRSFRTIICYLCRDGKLDKALELSKVMECSGWKHGSVIQNAITRGLLQCGRISEAESFLVQIEEKDLIPYNIDYDILIKQFCLHGNTTKAIDLLNIMLKKGNVPSEMSYHLVIHNLCYCKLFDQALDLHAEMLHKNLKQSVYSSATLVYGLCLNRRTEDARRTLTLLLQIGQVPTQSMFNCVIDRYYIERNLEKASEVLLEMQQLGYSPNFSTHWSLISNLNPSNNKGDDGGNAKGILSRLLSSSTEGLCG